MIKSTEYPLYYGSGKPRINKSSPITSFMGSTWGPPGAVRTQVGSVLATWTLLSGLVTLWYRDAIGTLWGNLSVKAWVSSQRPVMRICDFVYAVRLNKLLNRQSSCSWFETPRHATSLWSKIRLLKSSLVVACFSICMKSEWSFGLYWAYLQKLKCTSHPESEVINITICQVIPLFNWH